MREDVLDWQLMQAIDGSENYRLLRRLNVKEGLTGRGTPTGAHVGVVLDCETTGIDQDGDVIIELALRRFAFDVEGVVVKVDRTYSWLEDPGRPLEPDIVKLTGITDEDLAGQAIDEEAALRLLQSAYFVCAHNAAFDRPMLERRLPAARGLRWACSCNDVDWRGHGFDGRSLGWLLGQIGLFHDAHRASDDVDGVIALLQHRLPDRATVLARMVERAAAPSWRFRAVGANFDVKDRLRLRGYRWDARAKVWWREVPDAGREAEEWWLAGQIYTGSANPRALGPEVDRVTWRERYA